MTPSLVVHGTMPRRFFVPLTWSRGTYINSLHRIMKASNRGILYWGTNDKEWRPGEVALDDKLPPRLWMPGVTLLRRENDVFREIPLNPEKNLFYIDLSFSLRREDACALYVAWNPDPCPGDPAMPPVGTLVIGDVPWKSAVVQKSAPEDKGKTFRWKFLEDLMKDAPGPASEVILCLSLKELALDPLEPGDSLQLVSESPPSGGFFEKLFSWGKDRLWRFHLPKPFMVQTRFLEENKDDHERGALLALDFGTSATTVALIQRAAGKSSSDSAVVLSSRCVPWEHVSFFDSGGALTQGEHLVDHAVWRGNFQEIGGMFDAAPIHVARPESERAWVEDQDNPLYPSLLHELPSGTAEGVVDLRPCAVGHEAQNILRRREHLKGVEDRATVFSPKRYISCPAERHRLEGAFGGENPIELYLRRLFDDVYFEMLSLRGEESSRVLVPPLHRVCYSYPVAWTLGERKEFRQNIENALRKSFLREMLPSPDTQEGRELFSEKYALDEASAAFLGYVRRRFEGLDAGDVVRVLSPFSPLTEDVAKYPKTVEVLVVDCGEGTTDLVWLTVRDASGVQGDVESTVRHHFALDVSGLEVTRKIAEILKDMLLAQNPGARGALETLLDKPNIGKEFVDPRDPTKGTKRQYRRKLVWALYEEAERLKIAAGDGSSPEIQWKKILSATSLETPKESSLDAKLVKSVVDRVFCSAVAQIRRWTAHGPKLDLLLLSGRSGLVVGLQRALVEAIPEEYRPSLVDRVAIFALAEEGTGPSVAKMVVCDGLVQHCMNQMEFNRRALRCHPIDERRRTRAIGVLRETFSHQLVREFDQEHAMLVHADEGVIDADALLSQEVIWTEMESAGFTLGINFSGRPALGQKGVSREDYDSPRILCRYNLQWNGDRSGVARVRVAFRQVSASDLRIARVVLDREAEPEEVYELKDEEGTGNFSCGPLCIEARAQAVYEDFRMTGKIHLEGENAVDR